MSGNKVKTALTGFWVALQTKWISLETHSQLIAIAVAWLVGLITGASL